MESIIPQDITGKELFEFLVKNKRAIFAQKKSQLKRGDVVRSSGYYLNEGGILIKSEPTVLKASFKEDTDNLIQRTCIINTTYWYDSYGDVHIDSLWKKSLQENTENYLCQEHDFTFEGVITDEVKASAKKMAWRELGLEVDGTTEALVFLSDIDNMRNPFMFEQYKKNRVKNHSVGMQYKELFLAVNSEDWKDEFAVWNKYIDKIANKDEAIAAGYFFAITQAKIIEGSAVMCGANRITPTLSNASKSTPKGPDDSTLDEPQVFDIDKRLKNLQFNF